MCPEVLCRYLYAAALVGCNLLATFTVHQFWYQGIRVGVHLKTVIGTEVRAFCVSACSTTVFVSVFVSVCLPVSASLSHWDHDVNSDVVNAC